MKPYAQMTKEELLALKEQLELQFEEVKAKLLTLQYIRDELDSMGIKY